MRIGKLAEKAGVTIETVRYYQRRELLDIPQRPCGENRRYSSKHLDRLHFIKRAQASVFSLSEIESLLSLSTSDCSEAGQIANRKLLSIREKIADLSRIEAALAQAVDQCQSRQAYEGCPIIECFSGPNT